MSGWHDMRHRQVTLCPHTIEMLMKQSLRRICKYIGCHRGGAAFSGVNKTVQSIKSVRTIVEMQVVRQASLSSVLPSSQISRQGVINTVTAFRQGTIDIAFSGHFRNVQSSGNYTRPAGGLESTQTRLGACVAIWTSALLSQLSRLSSGLKVAGRRWKRLDGDDRRLP